MNNLRQIIAVTALGLRSIHTRFKSALVIVASLTCVLGVMISLLALVEGLALAYADAGDPNNVMVLSKKTGGLQEGLFIERGSALPRAWVNLIENAPGVRKASDGLPSADAEIYTFIHLTKKSNHRTGPTGLRGVGPEGIAIRPELKIISGRMFHPGKREIIVGAMAQQKFVGLDPGDQVALPDGRWSVVGVFLTGNFLDGDLVADSETLMVGLKQTTYNSVIARLVSPESFEAFERSLTGNPALSVMVERQTDYWKHLFDSLPKAGFYVIFWTVSFFVLMGAMIGTLHAMYAVVDSRTNEIAILRAIGFGGFAVAVSVVLEAMLLASSGAVIGTAIAWLLVDGYAYNGADGVFRVTVDLHLLLVGIGSALAIAFIGALSPAIKASRVTVVEALRAY
ncbi:MAG TPA: FtsX-like permease family protein [Rhizomicrobium sp.]|jgi:putative ABC transport system permease protein|nr:FtsX-like permease family protein [Rhizomicrobium sp.]